MEKRDRYLGCLVGLAVGDAVGTTVEFQPKGSFPAVTDMLGGGPFDLLPGQWTDDTSMALCLATSLLFRRGFDPADQMTRYVNWWQNGYLSCTGDCFDIGNTVQYALWHSNDSGNPFSGTTDPNYAGNGSIMRLAPVPMYYASSDKAVLEYSFESSRTTHGAAECLDACRYFGLVLSRALNGYSKDEITAACEPGVLNSAAILDIANGCYRNKSEVDIEGTGYVVRSLEAALWSFWSTSSFEEAILRAVNLGNDADTTAAICGQVAGAFYGESSIPTGWLEKLAMLDEIRDLATGLLLASEL